MEKTTKIPDRRLKNTKTISLRVEVELAREFDSLKRKCPTKDIPEAQRIALRDLAKKIREEF